jgi:hypothetical protein
MFGKEVEQTREQYVERWTQPALEQFCYLFAQHGSPSKLQEFLDEVTVLAGKSWDKSK